MSKHHVTRSNLVTPVVAIGVAILAASLVTFRPTPHATALQTGAGIDPYTLQLTAPSLPDQDVGDLY